MNGQREEHTPCRSQECERRLISIEMEQIQQQRRLEEVLKNTAELFSAIHAIQLQTGQILALDGSAKEKVDRLEDDVRKLTARINIGDGEKKTWLGFLSFIFLPLGAFIFWLMEYVMTGHKP